MSMKIKDYLSRNNMSQSEFAEIIGCSPAAVSRWVSEGKHHQKPSRKMFETIARKTRNKVRYSDIYDDASA